MHSERKIGRSTGMERRNSIDLLRIISAVAIVVIHTVSTPVANSPVDIDASLWCNLYRIHALMNWAVPVFFMITGYCLLKKPSLTYQYVFTHIWKYVCVLFTVGFAYGLMGEVFEHQTVNVSIVLQALKNVISGQLWDHMWFVYAIIGIYLVMPVIHLFMHQNERNAVILTALLFVFNILLPALEEVLPVGVKLSFDEYLFYVCMGGLLASRKLSKKWTLAIYLAGILALGWICFIWKYWELGYRHPAVCAMAVSIFLLVSNLDIKPGKMLLGLSCCTWGVYLIHPFFINVAIRLLGIDALGSHAYLKHLALLGAVLAASFGTTWVLRKIPVVKKLF